MSQNRKGISCGRSSSSSGGVAVIALVVVDAMPHHKTRKYATGAVHLCECTLTHTHAKVGMYRLECLII